SRCYFTTFVTNGSRRSRLSLLPVLRNVAAARTRKLYVFRKDRLEMYRKLGPPEVPDVCQLASATNIVPQARGRRREMNMLVDVEMFASEDLDEARRSAVIELCLAPLAGRSGAGLIPTPDQRGVMILRLRDTPSLDLDTLLTIEVQPTRIWE